MRLRSRIVRWLRGILAVVITAGLSAFSAAPALAAPTNNNAPVATSQVVTTNEEVAVVVTLEGVDSDKNSTTFSIVSNPTNGTLSSIGAITCRNSRTARTCSAPVTYTPNTNYFASDSFTYKANDGAADSNVATVSITVENVQDAPVGQSSSVVTAEDSAKIVTVQGSDADGDDLIFAVVTGPGKGTLSGFSNVTCPTNTCSADITYTPSPNANGNDSFTFKVNDGIADSASGAVTVTIDAVNDAPVAKNDTASTDEDKSSASFDVLANDTDVDGDALRVATYDATSVEGGTVDCDVSTGLCTYSPAADFFGTDSFTYTASDGTPSNVATVVVTVGQTADAPVCADDSGTTAEDTALGSRLGCSDVDGDSLTYGAASQPDHGTVTVASDGTFTYTPDADYNGPDSFTFSAGSSNVATYSITVTPVNDAPVATNEAGFTTAEDRDLVIAAADLLGNDSDIDGDDLHINSVGSATNGTVAYDATTDNITFTPDADFHGAAAFSYEIGDGAGGSDVGSVSLTVTMVNDAPVCADDSGTTAEDTALGSRLGCSDVDGDSLTYGAASQPDHGTVTVASDGTFTYTPDADYNGPDSFTFSAGSSNVAAYSITVTAVNDAPMATDDSGSTLPNAAAMSIEVTGNDSDVDDDTLSTASSGRSAENGSFSCSNTSCEYTPPSNFTGTDTFIYSASDGNGGFDDASVTMVVAALPPDSGGARDDVAPRAEADVDTEVISPNGDGILDDVRIAATFNEKTAWSLSIESQDSPVTSSDPVFSTSGEGTTTATSWSGRTFNGNVVADGAYRWRLSGRDAAGNTMSPLEGEIVVDTTAVVFTGLEVRTPRFDIRRDRKTTISFGVNEPAEVTVTIKRRGRTVKQLPTFHLGGGERITAKWRGRNASGEPVASGRYRVVLGAVDGAFNTTTNRALFIRVRR